jgi:hypothetical protein
MDDKLNAPAEIDKLKNAAKRGTTATIELRGAAGSVISRRRLNAELD